jgi:hypothetical protein
MTDCTQLRNALTESRNANAATFPRLCRSPHSTFTPVAATTRVHFSTSAAI